MLHPSTGTRIAAVFVVVFCVLEVAVGEESLQSLITTISSKGDFERKKTAYQELEKKATRGDYQCNEMFKRGILKPLFSTLRVEYGNPLEKEAALALLNKMAQHSTPTCDSIVSSDGILDICDDLIKRGTTGMQLYTIGIFHSLVQSKHRKIFHSQDILEGVISALRTGTPPTREKAVILALALVNSHEDIRAKLLSLGLVDYLNKLQQNGTPNAKRQAAATLSALEKPVPKQQVENTNNNNKQKYHQHQQQQQHQQKQVQFNDNSNIHNHGDDTTTTTTASVLKKQVEDLFFSFEFLGDSNDDGDDEILRSWWQSPLKQTRKIAQNNYKLRSPPRFRHK